MAKTLITSDDERVVCRIDPQPDDEYGELYWAYCRACRTVTTAHPFDAEADALAEAAIHVDHHGKQDHHG